MTAGFVEYPVTLTDIEAGEIDEGARVHGVTPVEYVTHCARVGAFGATRASAALAVVAQVGPTRDTNSGK